MGHIFRYFFVGDDTLLVSFKNYIIVTDWLLYLDMKALMSDTVVGKGKEGHA